MSERKIVDAKKDGNKIYFKGHAKATFMSDGRNIEDAINNIDIPVTAATGDNFGQIKINGTNVTVKGLATVDTSVSSGSTNLITSGGVYTGLTSISINAVTAGTSTTVKPGVLNKVSGTSVPCIFNFEKADTSTVAYEYIIQFETGNGNTPWVFAKTSGVKWADETVFIAESMDNADTSGPVAYFGANKKIQVSVLGGIAIACVVS